MLSASEARERSKFSITIETTRQLKKCEISIDNAISCGKTEVYLDFWVNEQTKNQLMKLGYVVNKGSERNESYTKISW